MKNLGYIWNRIIKKIPGSAIINTRVPQTSKIEARSTVIDSSLGGYSYAGYGCTIINCEMGNFTSVADNVKIGLGDEHPLHWASTSPAFYYGRDSIPKDLAAKEYDPQGPLTKIGNDVWIGTGSYIKAGVSIGDGAVIGMGSIVTRDVPPYAVVAGTPAKLIRYRFDEEVRERLIRTEWWNLPKNRIRELAKNIDDVEMFISKAEESL